MWMKGVPDLEKRDGVIERASKTLVEIVPADEHV